MKALYKLVFIACLIASSLFSQDKSDNDIEEISQEEWNDIVDYVNAEVTGITMRNHRNRKKSLGKEEEKDFQVYMELLEKNNIKEPIPFSEITTQLKKNWGVTFENISQPIESLKNYEPKVLDSLFSKFEIVKSYKTLKLNESSEYADLKKEFLPTQQPEKIVQNIEKKEPGQAVVVKKSNIQRTEKRPSYNYWMIPTLFFLISTITLFVMWRKTIKKRNELEERYERESKISKSSISALTRELNELKSINSTIKAKPMQRSNVNTYRKPEQQKSIVIDEPKAPEIELIPVEKPKVPQVLYAGKPTTEGKFSPVSSSPLSGQTIYKLNVHEDGLTADFEIELVDQFITREVTNAPDEYLYRVCNQENSNKDFSREIITTKKGLAILIDGNWVVKEANKATIKFQ
ncbi:hypothetical protein [Maribacter spongiicola]|uniref:hypothetical protein n=1 Tax=Maribacter spongiicola TaxID=1206753 RepID=UPI003F9CDA4B